MTYALFLDDERLPPDDGRPWAVARSVAEARALIAARGWPLHVSFDHDLGTEETGKTFADWMVAQALDGAPAFPEGWTFSIHSQNPVGAANIRSLLEGYLRTRRPPSSAS
jgi:hypothetical protein